MTYAQYGKIEYTDYNTFVGNAVIGISTANTLNTVWGIGSGRSGYGQAAVAQVAQYATVGATEWANLINRTSTAASHQGTAITTLTPPTTGTRVDYLSAINTNLTSIFTNRNNATAQGATPVTSTVTNAVQWSNSITFTHIITFGSGDQARYFFNAGGQIKLQFSHPTGTGVNALFSTLATACGTVVLSSPISGVAYIAGGTFNGITKVGGSGTTTTLLPNAGYYNLTTVNQEVFKQLASGTPAGYVGSFISVNIKSNGTQGINGDAGSTITITTTWDEVPDGGTTLRASAGTATTCQAVYPSTGWLSNSWGTVSITGSVTGS